MADQDSLDHERVFRPNAAALTMAAGLVSLVGLLAFGGLAAVLPSTSSLPLNAQPGEYEILVLNLAGLLLASVVLSFLLLIVHEACHGIAFRSTGARPRYGTKLVQGLLPVLYATAPGHWMTKGEYLLVALAPTVIINVAGIALMLSPTVLRYSLGLPLALHLGGCVGDWWVVSVLAHLPAGARFEDNEEGFRCRL